MRWRYIKVVVREHDQFVRYPVATAKSETYNVDAVQYLELYVPKVKWGTKPDPRTAIALSTLESPLRRWRQETDFPDEEDFVFCHQIGSRNLRGGVKAGDPIQSFSQQFRDFLRRHELLIDINGKHRTLTSCRHTYATQRLIHSDMGVYELARCMGTSIQMIEKIYGHVVPTDFATKAAKLPPWMQKDSQADRGTG